MKEILPELLAVNNLKNYYETLLTNLCSFVEEEFGNEEIVRAAIGNGGGEGNKNGISVENVGEIIQQIMLNLKKINREENKKIKEI